MPNRNPIGRQIQRVAERLRHARHAAALTGAGISTESGIPDFRSPGGIWSQTQPVYFDDFVSSEAARSEYWRQKAAQHRDFSDARPNAGHRTLAAWEGGGLLEAVITQNIDGLHQDAGSRRVLELHGTARHVACLECEARFDAAEMVEQFLATNQPPTCPRCHGMTKHATVSFGQALPQRVLEEAVQLSHQADVFLAMGSSLLVHPAASLPALAAQAGGMLVIINREATPLDAAAEVVIQAPIGETLVAIDRLMTATD